jgi:MSHA biogenesis protein MshQ
MPPTVVAVGAVASSASAITPAFPASIVADDILVTVAECEGVTTPGAYTLPSGWAHVTGSPVQEGTNTRLWVIWRRYDGVFTAPSLGDAGDHNVGRMIAIRGCPTAGNPWDIVASAVEATSDTSATWPGVTTTVDDCLILEIIATGADVSTAQVGALTNATYTSIVEQMDNWVITGNGGGIGMVSATKATAGATGQSTATLTTASSKALMTLAMRPVPPDMSWWRRPGQRPRVARWGL